jgi:hypothetical protein
MSRDQLRDEVILTEKAKGPADPLRFALLIWLSKDSVLFAVTLRQAQGERFLFDCSDSIRLRSIEDGGFDAQNFVQFRARGGVLQMNPLVRKNVRRGTKRSQRGFVEA